MNLTAPQLTATSWRLLVFLLALASAMVFIVPSQPAEATASAGASGTCAPGDNTKCVIGNGAAVSAGTSVTGAKIAIECTGEATRSSITEITCYVPGENISQTRSYDGTAAASVMLSDIGDIDPREVCWVVTGYFTDLFGGTVEVVDRGCAILNV